MGQQSPNLKPFFLRTSRTVEFAFSSAEKVHARMFATGPGSGPSPLAALLPA
jgi:hypothetical protein